MNQTLSYPRHSIQLTYIIINFTNSERIQRAIHPFLCFANYKRFGRAEQILLFPNTQNIINQPLITDPGGAQERPSSRVVYNIPVHRVGNDMFIEQHNLEE